jgi:hypothetical protein
MRRNTAAVKRWLAGGRDAPRFDTMAAQRARIPSDRRSALAARRPAS